MTYDPFITLVYTIKTLIYANLVRWQLLQIITFFEIRNYSIFGGNDIRALFYNSPSRFLSYITLPLLICSTIHSIPSYVQYTVQ